VPYIKPERRPDLDPILQKLWNAISKGTRGIEGTIHAGSSVIPRELTLDEMKGDVNYCFTKILITMLKKFGKHYCTLSDIRAIPQDVHDEFEEQFMKPYEKKKKEENGEVAPLLV